MLINHSHSPFCHYARSHPPSNLETKRVKVFRALANLLELLNYSMTFYIYCLFSEDFRNTLARTMKWPWFGDKSNAKRNNNVSIHAVP
jgi:hypothetical protein